MINWREFRRDLFTYALVCAVLTGAILVGIHIGYGMGARACVGVAP